MEPAHHTDPLEEALSHGSQRVAQVASLAAAMAQVVMQHRALADARKAMLNDDGAAHALGEQERLLHQQTRLGWAPAHDPHWLAQADLLQTARAWAAAAAYADTDPTAASAMRRCEDRLRTLHPYAMARYNRLRRDGMSPLDAMQEAAPLFARAPNVRVGDPPAERSALTAGTGREFGLLADEAVPAHGDPETDADSDIQAEARGREIVDRLQSRARAAGRPELGPGELTMVLEAVTNLPQDVIGRLARPSAAEARARGEENRAAGAGRARATDLDAAVDLPATPMTDEQGLGLTAAHLEAGTADAATAHAGADRSAAQLAAQSFPYSAAEAVQAARTAGSKRATRIAARTAASHTVKPPKRSL